MGARINRDVWVGLAFVLLAALIAYGMIRALTPR